MKKFVKENWFVVVVAVFFVVISIYYAYDQHKDDLPGKKVNGKAVVYSVDDTNVTADDVYDGLYKNYGNDMLAQKFNDAVLDYAVKTTDELNSEAQSYADYYANMYSYYGGMSYLNQVAKGYGYPDFKTYMLYSIKTRNMCNDYIAEHLDEYVTEEFLKEHNPRMISYALIKFEKPEEPTEDDLARLKAAQEAWASDEYNADNFADFAKKYSEDSSTASGGGVLGYLDKESDEYIETFRNAAMELTEGQVTDWVFAKEYGYFLIKCDSTKVDDFKGDSAFTSRILEHYENASNEILWHYGQQAGIKFGNDEIKQFIMKELGLESEDK